MINPQKTPLLKLILLFLVLLAGSLACTNSGMLFPTPTIPTLEPWTPPPTEEPQAPVDSTPVPAEATEVSPPGEEAVSVLFFDDFSNPESGWDRVTEDKISTDYSGDAYRIRVSGELLFLWANPGQNFNDVTIEVFASPNSEEEDYQYGIICRHQDINHWYALVVSPDGYAAIRKKVIIDGEKDIQYLSEWTEAPAVIRGNATNLLRAECVGDRLTLYVNGVQTVETFDSDYTSGDVGLATGTYTTQSAEVLFDDFIVTKP